MNLRRALMMGAFASIALMAAGANVRADYTFSTSSAGVMPFGTGSTMILTGQPTSQLLNGTGLINVQDVEIASTKPPTATDSGLINFTFTLSLVSVNGPVQVAAPGVGTTTFTGSINVTRADVGGELSSFVSLTAPSITVTSGNITTVYSFSGPQYAGPVVNSAPNSVGAGNLSIVITPTTTITGGVPEPASLAMMGTGLVGVVGLGLRRGRKSRA